jgi:hypothetical protein
MNERVWSTDGMINARRKPKYSEIKLSQCQFAHHKPYTDWPRIEPETPQWEVPGTPKYMSPKQLAVGTGALTSFI